MYVYKLTGVTLRNFGVGGATAQSWYERYQNTGFPAYDFAIIALGVNGAGFESPAKKALRLIANKLGFGKAVEALDKVEQEYEAEQKAQEEAEKAELEMAQAKYREAWRNAIVNGVFDGSLDEYIAERQEEERKQEEARKAELERQEVEREKAEYRSAVANNGYTGSFVEWQRDYKAQ